MSHCPDCLDLCGGGLEFRDLHGPVVLASAPDLELLPADLRDGAARGKCGECFYESNDC